ncbi:MAG: aspartyl protease family protein [Cyclobacteriaceae bacterium]
MKNFNIKLWTFSVSALFVAGIFNVLDKGFVMIPKQGFEKNVVKFQYPKNQILTKVHINDKGPFNFFIDTGIHPSAISLPLAKKIGLNLGPKAGNVGGFGRQKIPYYRTTIKKLKIGEMEVSNLPTVATEMSHLETTGLKIDGILGYSFLKDRVTSINYKRKEITFSDQLPENYLKDTPLDELVKFPLRLAGGKIPMIPNLTINEKVVEAWLDTGSSRSFGLLNQEALRLGLTEIELADGEGKGIGARGEFEVRKFRASRMSIGTFNQDSVVGFGHNLRMQNVVGNPFLEKYRLTLDYVNKMVYLELNK